MSTRETNGIPGSVFRRRYLELNDACGETFAFRLGAQAGFYSELNNMILAVLYCLHSRIRFVLDSRGSLLFSRLGWQEFFEPFFPEIEYPLLSMCNMRSCQVDRLWKRLVPLFVKRAYGVRYLTQDLWMVFRDPDMAGRAYSIEPLNLWGSLLQVASA